MKKAPQNVSPITSATGSALTVYNYKEPLLAVKEGDGYGYYGALTVTTDGLYAQCHLCGGLFRDVGFHARQRHNVPVKEYRERFQLARMTSLISEELKEERKDRTIRIFAAMTPERRHQIREKAYAGMREWRVGRRGASFRISLETKNKRGTCPDQILAKVQECVDDLGYAPSKVEFIEFCGTQRYVHLAYKTFGSWKETLNQIKLTAREGGKGKGLKKPRKSDDQLLDILSLFYQENGRVPTEADCRRGWIPRSDVYTRRFGSLVRARELAGIPSTYRTGSRGVAII